MDIYNIWFSRIEISNAVKLKLLKHFDILEIFKMTKEELFKIGLNDSSVNLILCDEYKRNLEKYERFLINNKIKLISFKEKEYPLKLKSIPDLPAYIFVKGNVDILDSESVGIIGSRNCTENGKKIAYLTAKELGDKNINVISGLAIRNRHLCSQRKFRKPLWEDSCGCSKWFIK